MDSNKVICCCYVLVIFLQLFMKYFVISFETSLVLPDSIPSDVKY